MKKVVGFNMKVWRHQLDYMAQSLPVTSSQDLVEDVSAYIAGDISGQRSRAKTKTILYKIWVKVPEVHQELRDRALTLYPQLMKKEQLALHWGLTVLAYPFFYDVVNEIGRLMRLQEVVDSQQIRRKMSALYGERHSVITSTTAVLSTLREWGVIETTRKVENAATEKTTIVTPELKQWLAEVILRSSDGEYVTVERLNDHPAFFPFAVDVDVYDLRTGAFTVSRQGWDMVMVGVQ